MIAIKRIKYIFRILTITLLGLYIGLLIILNIPFVQKRLGAFVSQELRNVLKTEVSIGHVDVGLFNRIIIEDVLLKDQQKDDLIKVARLSAKFEILPLFEGRISINSVQLFGFNILLKKETPDAIPNYQYVLDAFASKDTTNQPSRLDLRINSILIRRGKLSYDVNSEPVSPNKFNASHIHLDNLAATLSIKALRNDTLNVAIRRFSFKEQSGFELKNVSLKATANNQTLNLDNLVIEFPHSSLEMEHTTIGYDSLASLHYLTDDVTYNGNLKGNILLSDFSSIVPELKNLNQPIQLSMKLRGQGKQLECPSFSLNDYKYMNLQATASFMKTDKSPIAVNGQISNFTINQEGLNYIVEKMGGKVPSNISHLQYLDFKGNVEGTAQNLKFNGMIQSGAGSLLADIFMNEDTNQRSFSGHLNGEDIHLGTLLNDKQKFGITNFSFDLKGLKYEGKYPESTIKGIIPSLEYCGYRYENITLDGTYKNGGFNGILALDDENGAIQVNGFFNTNQPKPVFNLQATVNNFRPHELNLSDKYKDSDISFKLAADFTGNSIENINGHIQLDSLSLNAPDNQSYFMEKLTVIADQNNKEKRVRIQSSFMNALIEGDYSYPTLPSSILRTIQQYIPSLVTSHNHQQHPNNFKFDIRLENTELFEKLFHLPIQIHMPSTLNGYFSDTEERLKIEGHFPQLTYNGTLYESGVIHCENSEDQIHTLLRGNMLMNSGAMLNLSLNAQAKEDRLETELNWGNNTNVTYGGKLKAITTFSKSDAPSPHLQADIEILPTQMILNDSIWNIHPSHIGFQDGNIYIDNFLVKHREQHLRIDGKLTDTEKDSCLIDLNNVNVQYVLDILQFDDVQFGGFATGNVHLKQALKEPIMSTHLNVHDFKVNQALLGNADITGAWDNELGGIRLEANIEEKDISSTHVTGYVSPKMKGLDLNIEADSTNIGLITPFMEGIFSEINGRVNGDVRLYGPFKFLDLEGGVRINLDAKLDALNTYFQIKNDSIHIQSGELAFNDLQIFDREGNNGIVNGYLHHQKLKNLMYYFNVQTNNLLVYHTTDPGDMSFFGKVYGTGSIIVDGGNNAMNVDASITTGRNTTFTYVSGITTEATNNQFITFVDKTPKRIQDIVETDFYHYSDAQKKEEEKGPPMDLRIYLQVDATPDASMKVVMDPVAGDHITARGNGNLQVNFYNKGDFRMFGNYIIEQGMYKLSMQEVIRKDFALQSGGTVTFTGDPYHANLDLQAVHTVNSVSLSDLSADASLNNSTVKVNCIMNLTGSLANPIIRFDLDLPTVNEEDRELVRSATSTEEQMNTQIIYLLGIGKFYTVDYSNNANQSSNATSSLAFNTLSGQLNNMLSQWTENKNWNIGANLSTGQEGWSDVEAEAILSGRLLNNRLLINGNFGYRENVLANTNFVGDFEAIWLLTPNGEFRLRGYNQTNDRYFTKSTLTTQGIGFIYKKDFNSWSELYQWLVKKGNRKKNKKVIKEDTPLSIP